MAQMYGAPVVAAVEVPAYGQPVYQQQAYGAPAYGQPVYAQPGAVYAQPGAVYAAPAPTVVVEPVVIAGNGNCPQCRNGWMYDEYNCCGILCAVIFFPIGIICCYMMRDRRCRSCGFLESNNTC